MCNKYTLRRIAYWFLEKIYPNLIYLRDENISWNKFKSTSSEVKMGENIKIHPPFHIHNSEINDYTYINQNSIISFTTIGKFCSIGPNLLCGWGIHPTDGISTHPMFYSTKKQNGITLTDKNIIDERLPIYIGNDVFIGANVTILDGVSIGDGAIIGAGSIVTKNIPPYAIAVGAPIQIIKYRFDEKAIEKLLKIKWWDFDQEKLKNVQKYFFDINTFFSDYE
jgi:virginiamycin A acetyltransferase